jgi:hypothetical protein
MGEIKLDFGFKLTERYYAVVRYDKRNKRFSIGIPTKVAHELKLAPKDYLKVVITKIPKP